jgi:dTDP-4-dehydrorhamnose reductase
VRNDAYLLHVSTDYVFDGQRTLFEPYLESDGTAPVSEYGRSKRRGEEFVLESGAQAAILRTAWLYGAHGKNFLKTMLRLALQDSEREIRVVNDQFGSPTWSMSLARQMAAVAEDRLTGVFHATSEGHGSWYDLARTFLEKMEVPFRMVPCDSSEYPTPARRPKNSILENQRLKEAGINLFRDWKEELDAFVQEHAEALKREVE